MHYGEFFFVWLLVALSPGATAFMIMSQALRGGMRGAFRGLLGLQAGHATLFLLLYSGLSLSGSKISQLLPWLQRAGALILLWVSLRLFYGVWKRNESKSPHEPKGSKRYFFEALLMHLSNPGAVLFTFALLPSYLVAREPLPGQLLKLAAIMLPVDFAVMGSYAWLASHGGKMLGKKRYWVEILAGILIGWVGIRLLLS